MSDNHANQPKPGYKSTEFWLSLAAVFVSAVLASGAVTNELALQMFTIAATALAALGYTGGRTLLKRDQAKSATLEKLANRDPT